MDVFLAARGRHCGHQATATCSWRGATFRAATRGQAYAEAYGELLARQLRQAERSDEPQRGRILADLTAMLPDRHGDGHGQRPDGAAANRHTGCPRPIRCGCCG